MLLNWTNALWLTPCCKSVDKKKQEDDSSGQEDVHEEHPGVGALVELNNRHSLVEDRVEVGVALGVPEKEKDFSIFWWFQFQ